MCPKSHPKFAGPPGTASDAGENGPGHGPSVYVPGPPERPRTGLTDQILGFGPAFGSRGERNRVLTRLQAQSVSLTTCNIMSAVDGAPVPNQVDPACTHRCSQGPGSMRTHLDGYGQDGWSSRKTARHWTPTDRPIPRCRARDPGGPRSRVRFPMMLDALSAADAYPCSPDA
jgi:hypothetical protein